MGFLVNSSFRLRDFLKIGVGGLLLLTLGLGCTKLEEEKVQPITAGSLLASWQVQVGSQTWDYRLSYQAQGQVSGAKVVDTLVIPFTGTYDSASRTITLVEEDLEANLCGRFEGSISDDLSRIDGTWTSYGGISRELSLERTQENANEIVLPSSGRVQVIPEYSEALFSGLLGLAEPESLVLCENYHSCIGDTLVLGPFPQGTRLVFFIYIYPTDYTYYSLNYDHAMVTQLDAHSWRIHWEDSENIDRDFNDLILRVSVIPAP